MLSQHVPKTIPEPEPPKTNSKGEDSSLYNNADIYDVLKQNADLKDIFKKFLPCMAVISTDDPMCPPIVCVLRLLKWNNNEIEYKSFILVDRGDFVVDTTPSRNLPRKGSLTLIHDAASFFQRKETKVRAYLKEMTELGFTYSTWD